MNLYPSFTNIRSFTSYQFSRLRMRAVLEAFLAKISGKEYLLSTFPAEREHPNRKLLGVKNIHVSKVVGSLNRTSDFDHQFRPLGKHLLNRWVNTSLLLDVDGWAPILVHKIGEDYYVEDGHHRVSVARALGMVFIEATVWEHPTHRVKIDACPERECVEMKRVKAYATD